MISAENPSAQLILGIVSAVVVLVLLYNTLQAGSRPYRRFVKFRSSWKRRNLMRKWLNQSFIFFGTLSLICLLLAWQFIGPLLSSLRELPIVDVFQGNLLIGWAIIAALTAVLLFVPLLTVRVSKKGHASTPRAVELGALIPRNKRELKLGTALALNAALVEELFFRLALPAILFGATDNSVVTVIATVLLFGLANIYKGALGALSMTVLGALYIVAYIASGTILVPIVLHAIFELRSLVFIPVVFGRVHTLRARW